MCRNGHVELFEPGYIYRENDVATDFYVLLEGELVISRRAGHDLRPGRRQVRHDPATIHPLRRLGTGAPSSSVRARSHAACTAV